MRKGNLVLGFTLGVTAALGVKALIEKTNALNSLQGKYDAMMQEFDLFETEDKPNVSEETKKVYELFKRYPGLETVCVVLGEKLHEINNKTETHHDMYGHSECCCTHEYTGDDCKCEQHEAVTEETAADTEEPIVEEPIVEEPVVEEPVVEEPVVEEPVVEEPVVETKEAADSNEVTE